MQSTDTRVATGPENAVAQPAERPRRRGRPRADATEAIEEADLLRAAFSMFAERGYEASTMRALARELGVSHNLLNVRFGRKSQMWKAAVDWRLAEAARGVEAAFDESMPPEKRLRDLVRRFCRWAIDNSDIVAITQYEGRQQSWRLEHLLQHFILPFEMRLQNLLEDVGTESRLRPIGSSPLLALLVHGVGSYFALGLIHDRLQAGTAPGGMAEEQGSLGVEVRADALADFLLAGLFVTDRPA